MRQSITFSLFAFGLLLSIAVPAYGQSSAVSDSGNSLLRVTREAEVKSEKMNLHLQRSMRKNGIDMWIIMSREFHPDPVLDLFGGHGIAGWYGHRNAYIFSDPGGSAGLESVILGTHQSNFMLRFFDRIQSYGEEGLTPHLREYVRAADPQRIAINRSRTVSMADGITAEMLAFLENAVGEPYVSRFESSESRVLVYVGLRTCAGRGK
jgi:hypothetical protein